MTTIEITLSEDVARRARDAGLLSDSEIQRLLEEAIRRKAWQALLDIAGRIHATGIPPMSMEEIDAEVKAVRAERRALAAATADVADSASGQHAGGA